jgi:hypothetical protein
MIGYLRPSLMREAVTYEKDIEANYPRARVERRGGERAASTRLTADQVRWVRANARRNGGDMTFTQMAIKLGTSVGNIRAIVRRVTWKEIV